MFDINRSSRRLTDCQKGHIRWIDVDLIAKSKGKLWSGEIDIQDDKKDLIALAESLGEPVYIVQNNSSWSQAVAMASHIDGNFWYEDPFLKVTYDECGFATTHQTD